MRRHPLSRRRLFKNHTAIESSSGCASFLLFFHSGQQAGQRGAVDVDRHGPIRGRRQLEDGSVEPLVKQTQCAFRPS